MQESQLKQIANIAKFRVVSRMTMSPTISKILWTLCYS